jgi:hypothetical protein
MIAQSYTEVEIAERFARVESYSAAESLFMTLIFQQQQEMK